MTPYDDFVQAKHFRVGRNGKKVRLLVAHCTVSKEMGTGAEAVAKYFQAGTRLASAHCVGDNNSVVGCVKDDNTAFAAAGANNDGWHFEFVGMPDQDAAGWADTFSEAMLRRAAVYWRERADRWDLPHRWLTVDQVRDGEAGFCTHHDISRAYPAVSTGHWDPGPEFPKAHFLDLVAANPTPPPLEEDDVQLIYVRRSDQARVHLASVKTSPRPVGLFSDAEWHAALTGDEVVKLAAGTPSTEEIVDGGGNKRRVLVVADGSLYGIT